MRGIKKNLFFLFYFSVMQGAAYEAERFGDDRFLQEILSSSFESLGLPKMSEQDGAAILEAGSFFLNQKEEGASLDALRVALKFSSQVEFFEDRKKYCLEKAYPIEISFPKLENMCMIKKYIMTEKAEQRINSLSNSKKIRNDVSLLSEVFIRLYRQIDEIFSEAQRTGCFSSKRKKNEKIKRDEKERIHRQIDYLITDYQTIIATLNVIDMFNAQNVSVHYQQGTASQLVLANILNKNFHIGIFEMLTAFEYIEDKEDFIILRPDRMDALYKKHEQLGEYYLVFLKKKVFNSVEIQPFLILKKGFYVYHHTDYCIMFNDGKHVSSEGILCNEIRPFTEIEKSKGIFQIFELGQTLVHPFGRKELGTCKVNGDMKTYFPVFDLVGQDSFGQKFGYIKVPDRIDSLVDQLLYLESLVGDVDDLKKVVEKKALLFSKEDLKSVEVMVDQVRPQVFKQLEYDLESYVTHQEAQKLAQKCLLSSSESFAQQGIDLLSECEAQLEQAALLYKKALLDLYEKQIGEEQAKRSAAVASGKIYQSEKKSKGRGKQQHVKAVKDQKGKGQAKTSQQKRKEEEELKKKVEVFLKENQIKRVIKKRELDSFIKQMKKILDPEKEVSISSNVDGSHEIFHAEGTESVTLAGHGNNPEYSASVANEFLMKRAYQLAMSKRFSRMKKELEKRE
jgi:hypothetical protein